MTKQEAMRQARQENALCALGFTLTEAAQLRRISMTLRRWHELECGDGNGYIERDEKSGKPVYVNCRANYIDPHDPRARHVVADREKGAQNRLLAIINALAARKGVCNVNAYIQGDPRGAALYILRPGDIPEGQTADSCYSRGICVY